MEKKNTIAIVSILIALLALLLIITGLLLASTSTKGKAAVENFIDPFKSLGKDKGGTGSGIINIFDDGNSNKKNNDDDDDNNPVISGIPDINVDVGSSIILDLDDFASDDEDSNSQLTFDIDNEVHSHSPSPFTISLNFSTNEVTVSAANGSWTGSETVTITVEVIDTDGNTDEDIFVATIDLGGSGGPNDPVITPGIPDITFLEDGSDSSIDLDDYVTDPDHNDSEITWTFSGNSDVIISIDNTTHVVTFTATPNWNGAEFITFRATDPLGGYVEDDILVTVTPVDDPAVWSPLSNQTITANSPDGTIVYPNIDAEVTDIDSPIVISIASNVEFTIEHTGSDLTLDGLTTDWTGSELVVLSANGVTASFTLTVTPVIGPNNAPTLVSNLPNLVNNEDSGTTQNAILLENYFTDAEDGASGLTYTIQSQTNTGVVSASIDGSNRIDYTTLANQFGFSDVTIRATDTGGLFVEDTFRITINSVNDNPTVSSLPDQTTNEDVSIPNAFDLDNFFNDVEQGSSLNYNVQSNTNSEICSVTIDGQNRVDITPAGNKFGVTDVTIRGTDNGGLFTQDTFRITINQLNDDCVEICSLGTCYELCN